MAGAVAGLAAGGARGARAQAQPQMQPRIERLAPEFDKIISVDEPIKELASGFGGSLGPAEGPLWWKEGGLGYWPSLTRSGAPHAEGNFKTPSGKCEFGREYATTQPSAIREGVALERSPGGGDAVRLVSSLPALVGAWRHVGGGAVEMPIWEFPFNFDFIQRPDWIKPGTRVVNDHLAIASIALMVFMVVAGLGAWMFGNSRAAAVDQPARHSTIR